MNFVITKICASISDSGKDENTGKTHDKLPYKFRLKDDDDIIYAYGYCKTNDDERAFTPLEWAECEWGCTSIEYKNEKTGEYEPL